MARKVGSVYAEIRAKLDKLDKDFAKAHSMTLNASTKIQKSIDRISFDRVGASADRLKTKLGVVFAGIGTAGIAKNILDVNASFERMQAKLDTLNPGKGKETFDYLYNLVRDLPTGIESITQGFITMTAMGLKPTERQILTLIDAASVLGEDTFGRIVLQLGQMTTKGKVMAEDLTILAEAGVNARDMIKQAFGMTVDEIQKTGVDIRHVTDTIFEGMEVQFGGASKRMANTWDGVTAQMKKAWQELAVVLGDAGVFEAAKNSIKELTEQVKMLAKFAGLRSVLETRAEGMKFVSQGILDKSNFEAADVYRKQEMVDWARKFSAAGFETGEPGRGNIPTGYRSGLGRGVTDKRHLVSGMQQVKEETSAAAKEADKFRQEIEKLQDEFEQSKIFSGDHSTFGIVEQQLRSGAEISQMYAEAAKVADESFVKIAESENERLMQQANAYEDTFKRIDNLSERTAESMQDNFSDLFFDAMMGELKTFEDYATAVFTSIKRMAADMMAQQLAQGLFGPEFKGGGWLSQAYNALGGGAGGLAINQPGYPGAATFHSGGVVGVSGGASRPVPLSAFSFAPRYHSGLMPDEQPAILQKGETVIPKGGAMGGATNNYYVQAMDVRSFVDYLRKSGAVPMLAAEDVRGNGALRRTMKSKW